MPVASAVSATGDLYLLGNFTRVNGIATGALVRFSPTGQLDSSFQPMAPSPAAGAMLDFGDPRPPTRLFLTTDGTLIHSGNGPTLAWQGDGQQDHRYDALLAATPYAWPWFETAGEIYFYDPSPGGGLGRFAAGSLTALPFAPSWTGSLIDATPSPDGTLLIIEGAPAAPDGSADRTLRKVAADGSANFAWPAISLAAGQSYRLSPLPAQGFRLTQSRGPTPILWPLSQVEALSHQWFAADGTRLRTVQTPYGWNTPRIALDEADGSLLYSIGPAPEGTASPQQPSPFAAGLTLVRLRPDGSRDPGFALALDRGAARLLDDGRIHHSHLRRALPNGAEDPSWQMPVLQQPGIHRLQGRLPDGRILSLLGDGESRQESVLLESATLARSPDFSPPSHLPSCHMAAACPDGTLLLALRSPFTLPDDSATSLLRLRADGSIHPDTPRLPAETSVFPGTQAIDSLAVQPSGKILVHGYRPGLDVGTWITGRLLTDGASDPTFQAPAAEFSQGPLNVLADGRFFLGAGFFSPDGQLLATLPERIALAALTSDAILTVSSTGGDLSLLRKWRPGSGFDSSFQNPFLPGSSIRRLATVDAGKIVVSGELLTASGPRTLVRLHANGQLDPTFRPPLAVRQPGPEDPLFPYVFARQDQGALADALIYLAESQTLLASGDFTRAGDQPRASLAALQLGTAAGFTAWMQATLPDNASGAGGPDDDFDGDGASNFLEYCVGYDPATADPLAHRLRIKSQAPLVLALPRNPEAPEVRPRIEVSSDLAHWQAGTGAEVTLLSSSSEMTYILHGTLNARFTRVRFDP